MPESFPHLPREFHFRSKMLTIKKLSLVFCWCLLALHRDKIVLINKSETERKTFFIRTFIESNGPEAQIYNSCIRIRSLTCCLLMKLTIVSTYTNIWAFSFLPRSPRMLWMFCYLINFHDNRTSILCSLVQLQVFWSSTCIFCRCRHCTLFISLLSC